MPIPALLAFALQTATTLAPKAAVARLSGDAVPISYDLRIRPFAGPNGNWSALRVDGTETILVRTTRDLDDVVMNASHASIREASIDGEPAVATLDQGRQQLSLRATRHLLRGEHTIRIVFESAAPGPGFRSFGFSEPALATIFEQSKARAVFPCFDEPQFRATFTLHVRAPSRWDVVSNMPAIARTPQSDGADSFDFQPTPPMPVYLLTFDMGVFAHVDGHAGATPIRVFVRPGKEPQAAVVLADAERLLPYYERFFATRYPLPKLDIVVVNGGFETALEGWGAITSYAEDQTFGDELSGGRAGRLLAVQIVAHEMAHQWVGDLVTMRWWRDTFVAEGLAEFAQQRAVADLFPELDSWVDDDRDAERILAGGVAAGGHAVVADIATDLDDDDAVAFSGAVYEKGAAVVRQWQRAIGDAAFQPAMAGYLRAYAYGSASVEDFWSAFPDARSLAYGNAWLKRQGFPLVDLDATCAAGRTTVALEQRAYVTDPRMGTYYRRRLWPILLQIDVAGHDYSELARAQRRSTFTFPGCGIAAIDADFRPYARIRYGGDAAAALGVRPVRERNRIFYDYAALHDDGYLTTRDYLDAVASPQAFAGLGLAVTGTTATQLDQVRAALTGSPIEKQLVAIERSILIPALDAHPLDERIAPADRHGALRSLFALAAAGDSTFSIEARALFFKYAQTQWPNDIYDLQYGVAEAGGVTASGSDVERVERLLRDGAISQTGQLFLENVRDEMLLPAILRNARTDARVAGSPFTDFLFATGFHRPRFVYAYVRAHLREVRATVVPTQQAYVICQGVAANLWSAAPPAEIERFLRAAFPADAAITAKAAAQVREHWAHRRALEAALAN
jgi:aminopeptidase N